MQRKWWTLLVVSLATFMLLLDITVVNVALPSVCRRAGDLLGRFPAVRAGAGSDPAQPGPRAPRRGRGGAVRRLPGPGRPGVPRRAPARHGDGAVRRHHRR